MLLHTLLAELERSWQADWATHLLYVVAYLPECEASCASLPCSVDTGDSAVGQQAKALPVLQTLQTGKNTHPFEMVADALVSLQANERRCCQLRLNSFCIGVEMLSMDR